MVVTLRVLGIANSGIANIYCTSKKYCKFIIAYSVFRVQHIRIIVIILVQSAAIKAFSSVRFHRLILNIFMSLIDYRSEHLWSDRKAIQLRLILCKFVLNFS